MERFHQTLKNALRAHTKNAEKTWLENLPEVLLGIRNAVNSETQLSPSQSVLGTNIRLPGDIIIKSMPNEVPKLDDNNSSLLRSHGTRQAFIPKDLQNCKQVWVKIENRRPLQPIYEGPFTVISRSQDMKTMKIQRRGHQQNISIDKVKPTYVNIDSIDE